MRTIRYRRFSQTWGCYPDSLRRGIGHIQGPRVMIFSRNVTGNGLSTQAAIVSSTIQKSEVSRVRSGLGAEVHWIFTI